MEEAALTSLLRSNGLQGLVRRNNNIMACCPSHQERRPSWGISLTWPHYHGCFSCKFRGNLVSLLQFLGMPRKKALLLAGASENDKFLPSLEKSVRNESLGISEYALFPFYPLTMDDSHTSKALSYLLNRGMNYITIRRAGLLFDRQGDRVLFPWREDGHLVGLTGRALNPRNTVKTIPYFDTAKGQHLYVPFGELDDAPLILSEGESDALKWCSAKLCNAAALGFGTITKAQCSLVLNSPSKEVVLAFDGDESGRALTDHALKLFTGKKLISVIDYSKSIESKDLSAPDPAAFTVEALRTLYYRRTKTPTWFSF